MPQRVSRLVCCTAKIIVILCDSSYGITHAHMNATLSGPTVLVLYNAGPLDISWAKDSDKVVAIIEHFFPAQVS